MDIEKTRICRLQIQRRRPNRGAINMNNDDLIRLFLLENSYNTSSRQVALWLLYEHSKTRENEGFDGK